MAFQIKSFASIAASMLNYIRGTSSKVTDLSVGGVARTLVEAPAVELDELYQQMFNGIKEAIPVSLYTSLSFDARAAIAASGNARTSITSSAEPTLIAAGTVYTDPSVSAKYVSVLDVTIPAGATFADVRVVAQTPGLSGNIDAGKVFSLTPAPPNLVSATNLAPFKNGMDVETESDRKVRFTSWIQSLNRGTPVAIQYGLSTTELYDANGNFIERVATSSVVEPWLTDPLQPISLVKCYIHNGVGSTSSDLLARAREVVYGYTDASGTKVPGWKAAGVRVDVFIAEEVLVPVAGTLTVMTGYNKSDVVALAVQTAATYLSSLDIGTPAIKSELIKLIKQLPGVYDIVLTGIADQTTATDSQKLMPGSISIV